MASGSIVAEGVLSTAAARLRSRPASVGARSRSAVKECDAHDTGIDERRDCRCGGACGRCGSGVRRRGACGRRIQCGRSSGELPRRRPGCRRVHPDSRRVSAVAGERLWWFGVSVVQWSGRERWRLSHERPDRRWGDGRDCADRRRFGRERVLRPVAARCHPAIRRKKGGRGGVFHVKHVAAPALSAFGPRPVPAASLPLRPFGVPSGTQDAMRPRPPADLRKTGSRTAGRSAGQIRPPTP
jgi:hypothetical protein